MEEQRQLIYQILLNIGNSPDQAQRVASEIDNITKSANQASKATDQLSKAAQANAKLQQDMGRSAGLAGATVFELGRTISDLPYGIQAVTNNISQMGNLFGALVANAGGLKGAFSLLKQQLMGPTGILIAFQVVTAAVTFFDQKMRKSKEESEKVNRSLERQIIAVRSLRREFEQSGGNAEVLSKSALVNEDIAKSYAAQALSIEEVNKSLELQAEIKEAQAELAQREKSDEEAILKLQAEKADIIKDNQRNESVRENLRRKGFSEDQINAELESKRQRELDNLEARRENLRRKGLSEAQIMNETKDQELSILRTIAEVEADILKVKTDTSAIEEKKIKDAQELARLEKLGLERMNAQKELLDAQNNLTEKTLEAELDALDELGVQRVEERRKIIKQLHQLELKRLEQQKKEELKDIKDPEIIKATKAKFKLLAESAGVDLQKELGKATYEPLKIKIKGIVTLEEMLFPKPDATMKVAGMQLVKGAEEAQDALNKGISSLATTVKEEKDKMTFEDALQLTSQGLDAAFSLIDSAYEKELALEERKTVALNDQLRARLRNEKLSADERDGINQQIARNDAELLKKQNEIEEKRFKLNKAANISNAIINTALAITKALDFAFPASLVAASVVGAAGLAQIQAISNQTFVPKDSPSVNLSSQGFGGSIAPSFNVVGGSAQNQIAAAIAGKMNEPIKAYVVASDVTTAQQLERSIIEGASI